MNALKEPIIVIIMLYVKIQLDLTNVVVIQDIEEMELIVKVCLKHYIMILCEKLEKFARNYQNLINN